jgi:hypothetical protein
MSITTRGGYDQAVFTAEVADSAYLQLSRDFDWELPEGERIVIITYQSHNDFANTNVSGGLVEESVGGFTEFFKNRVVIPFQGSWEDYRHVIHHELTHAFSLSMVYGESILRGAIRFPLPLWFAEGSAEWCSRGGWDREANMFMADASISGYLGDIPQLYGFLAYKGGQSVFNYIEYEFGKPKIAEIMHKVKAMHNVERAFESSLGYGVEELSVRWKAYLNRIYWPTIQDRQTAYDLADRITNHRELRNFVNNSPAISPSGDRMIFLSDRTGYFDVYSSHITEPGKARRILHGQQSGKFESLHWLRPGISWSPDETRIAIASKAGDQDALFILDPESGKVLDEFKLDLEGLFSPAWSPAGDRIAFVALSKGRTDIRILDLETREGPRGDQRPLQRLRPQFQPRRPAPGFCQRPQRRPEHRTPAGHERRQLWPERCLRGPSGYGHPAPGDPHPLQGAHARLHLAGRDPFLSATRAGPSICTPCPPTARPCPCAAPTCSRASSSPACPARASCCSPVSSRAVTTCS